MQAAVHVERATAGGYAAHIGTSLDRDALGKVLLGVMYPSSSITASFGVIIITYIWVVCTVYLHTK